MKIAKNTKRARSIVQGAHDVRCYSLNNNFTGTPMSADPVRRDERGEIIACTQAEALTAHLAGRHSYLHAKENGRYVIHVHGNLWYEFAA